MLTNIYLYELSVFYNGDECLHHSFATIDKAVDAAWRRYRFAISGDGLLDEEEFKKTMRDKKWYDENLWSFDISRVKQEIDIPKVQNPTTVGDIVCGGFSAALEYVICHGVHEDGDVLWTSEVNGPLNEDDILANYVVTYLTIDCDTKRLIIETL